jgi:hypothetical protein
MELSKVTQTTITQKSIPIIGFEPRVNSSKKSDTELSFQYGCCLITELSYYKAQAEVSQ